jgi:FkbM family methyltransferase
MKEMLKQVRDRFASPLYPVLRKLGLVPRALYRHLPYHGVFTVEVSPGRRFKVEARGTIVENELFWSGFAKSWETASLASWTQHARKARAILDIGANTGIYALAAKACNPAATVIALEPSAGAARQLRRNVDLNGFPIRVEEVAASDRNGTATFFDMASEFQYSASLEPGMGGTVEVTVPVRRVDDLISETIDLVKIDVEMHEPAVLRGMRGLLERDRPVMLVEILNDDVMRGVEQALEGLDYRWTLLEDEEAYSNYLLEPAR